MTDNYRTTLKFKLPHSCMKSFKNDFPKFCEKNDVGCEITSECKWYWIDDAVTIRLTGGRTNTRIVEDAINDMLKLVF
jgi:hypothetical protein